MITSCENFFLTPQDCHYMSNDTVFQIRIPSYLKLTLLEHCKDKNIKLAELIRDLLKKHLDDNR